MKRRIILFCVSFLLSIGIFAAFYGSLHLLNSNGNGAADKDQAAEQPQAPETPATPDPADATDTATDAPDADTPSTDGTDATPQDPEPQPQVEQTPLTPFEMEQELIAAVENALRSDSPAEAVAALVADGKMEESTAAALLAWRERCEPGSSVHIGNISPENQNTTWSRWRLRSADGKDGILLDIEVADDRARVMQATPSFADSAEIPAGADTLAVAEGFLEAVRLGDMWAARCMVTGSEVSDATIAGLCMIFEEGGFTLREKSPLRLSFNTGSNAGYIVYLVPQEGPGKKTSNIGLELTNDGGWKISGVSMDSLLADYEVLGAEEGGHFFPIVKNPQGGDSLALFFSFDQFELSPRSLKQLRIVADLLIKSGGRLEISGHTDDIGSDAYNQRLSEHRAKAVKDALVSFGVPEGQISTSGMGMNQPRRLPANARNEAEADYIRGENRRAEIYLDFQPAAAE